MAATQTENITDTSINTFQIRPSVGESFKSAKVKKIIETVSRQILEGKKYTENDAKLWTKTISDEISKQVKELEMKKYKHVVQVILFVFFFNMKNDKFFFLNKNISGNARKSNGCWM